MSRKTQSLLVQAGKGTQDGSQRTQINQAGSRQRRGPEKTKPKVKNHGTLNTGKDTRTLDTEDKDELAQRDGNTQKKYTGEETNEGQVELIRAGQVITQAGNTQGQE